MTYATFDDLLADLRRSGSTARCRPPHGLMGRSAWAAARAAYERLTRDGRLPATLKWSTDTPGKRSRKRPPTGGRSSASIRAASR
jgi:malonyl-CoA O-methyltransferase